MTAPHATVLTVPSLAEQYGGPARTVPGLAWGLIRAGFDANVVCGAGAEGFLAASARQSGVGVVPVEQRPWARSVVRDGVRTMIADLVSSAPGTILHDNGCWTPFNHAVAGVARQLRCPFIITVHGMLQPWALRQKRTKKAAAWHLYQRRNLLFADVIHATAKQEVENLRTLGLNGPIAVIPNGTRLPHHRSNGRSRDAPSIALFLSRVHPSKGVKNLIEAWARVRPDNWRLVIAGPDEGGHLEAVRRSVVANNLGGVVDFVGPAADNDKWALFANSDLFILPTHSENFGMVVAEALASGVPVLTTKGAPWPELDKRECGWWIELGIDPLAEALQEATSLSRAERARMGARGRALVEEKYTWDRVGQQMARVYAWLLDGGSPPDCVDTG